MSFYEQIRTGDYVFPPKAELISREALDLKQKLLIVDPSWRLSSRDLLNHAWLKKDGYLGSKKAMKRLAEEIEDPSQMRKSQT